MVANRGLPSDYADWVARGAAGWNWDDVLPFFRKLEHDRDFDGPMHGKSGPVGLRRIFPDRWPGFTRAVFEAVAQEGWQDIKDQNAAFGDGYFPIAVSNIDDRRVSAAMAYLTREVRERPNLRILSEARAERLLLDGLRVVGVRARRRGAPLDIRARELIVSMGALQSPAFLMRSGIGPAAELSALGIDVVADRRGVGKNLIEHPGVNFGCVMKREARLPPGLRRQMLGVCAGRRGSMAARRATCI